MQRRVRIVQAIRREQPDVDKLVRALLLASDEFDKEQRSRKGKSRQGKAA